FPPSRLMLPSSTATRSPALVAIEPTTPSYSRPKDMSYLSDRQDALSDKPGLMDLSNKTSFVMNGQGRATAPPRGSRAQAAKAARMDSNDHGGEGRHRPDVFGRSRNGQTQHSHL